MTWRWGAFSEALKFSVTTEKPKLQLRWRIRLFSYNKISQNNCSEVKLKSNPWEKRKYRYVYFFILQFYAFSHLLVSSWDHDCKKAVKGCSHTTCSAAETNNAHSTSAAAATGVSAQICKLTNVIFGGLSFYNNLKNSNKALQLLHQWIEATPGASHVLSGNMLLIPKFSNQE